MTGLSNTSEKSKITPEKSEIRMSDSIRTLKLSLSLFHVTFVSSLYLDMSLSIISFSEEKDWGWGLMMILYPVDKSLSISCSPKRERRPLSPHEGARRTVLSWAGTASESSNLFFISSIYGMPQRAISLAGRLRASSSCLICLSWYSPDTMIAS